MFHSFTAFTNYIESLPVKNLTNQEKENCLAAARNFIAMHDLIPKMPIITVTGTNGKGSTVKALAEILVHHGLNVFAFTSPHLIDYSERFAYNLQFVDQSLLLHLANTLSALTDLASWNFFFILFFIQLLLCKEYAVDCLLLEVGLGGRLDPTNAVDASLVILTQVALDHTDILGDTREHIGLEKAGLLRAGIPFICGDPNPPSTVLAKAKSLHCRFYQFNKQFGFTVQNNRWRLWLEEKVFAELPLPKLHLTSISCALLAVKLLFPQLPLSQVFMETQLPNFYLAGRYQQLIYEGTEFVIDVSHNPAASEALANFLKSLPKKTTCAIFGAKATKDIASIIAPMRAVIDDWYLVPLENDVGIDMKALSAYFVSFSVKSHNALSVADAIHAIFRKDGNPMRIVVFGSFSVAGPALAFVDAKIN